MTTKKIKCRKKPVLVEALQHVPETRQEIIEWCPGIIRHALRSSGEKYELETLLIPTLEGAVSLKLGDYLVKGSENEFWPIKKSIFEKTYEKVEE